MKPRPTHAYIPGRTPRHPEDTFADIRGRALDPTVSATAGENPAWLAGLDLLEAGFYWEAHEVLEAVWMNAAANAPERFMVQALIQLANAALKQVMEQPRAARRLCGMTRDLLQQAGEAEVMGLAPTDVAAAIDRLEAAVRAGRIEPVRIRPPA